jgi:hypothetical protein
MGLSALRDYALTRNGYGLSLVQQPQTRRASWSLIGDPETITSTRTVDDVRPVY